MFSCHPGVGPGGAGAGGVLGGGAGRGDEFWMMISNIFPVSTDSSHNPHGKAEKKTNKRMNTDSFFYFSGIFC